MVPKRFICLLLAALLLLGFAPVAAAAPGVYFTMINSNDPEPLSAQTMPLNRNGTFYVPVSTLARVGIISMQTTTSIRLALSRDVTVFVHFDLAEGGGNVTHQGDSLPVAPLLRFDTYFFPVGTTSTGPLLAHFGVNYRFIASEPVPIVRLYNESLGILTHDALLRNADVFYDLTGRLSTFLGDQQEGETGGETITGPPNRPPPPPPPPPPDPGGPEGPGTETPGDGDDDSGSALPANVSLSFVGITDETEALLDTLNRAGIPAGFFVTAEHISDRPDLIRRLHGEGHQLGIYLIEDAEAEYIAASEALFNAARLRTLLVVAENEAGARQAEALGLIVYEADIVRQFTSPGELESLPGDLLLYSGTTNSYALAALTALLRSGAYQAIRMIHSIFTF